MLGMMANSRKRGGLPVEYISASRKTSNVNTVSTVVGRGGYIEGDLFLCSFGGGTPANVNTLSGWTEINNSNAVFYKISGPSEPTSYTWTHSSLMISASLAIFRNASGIGGVSIGSGTAVPSIIPSSNDSQVIYFGHTNNPRDWSCSLLTGYTTRICVIQSFSGRADIQVRTVNNVVAGTGTPTGTIAQVDRRHVIEITP